MDDTNSGNDLNLDPDMMTTQGGTPQADVVIPTTPIIPTPSNIIDITPGAQEQTPLTPSSVHIDESVTPAPRVEDITPPVNSPPQPEITTAPMDLTPPVSILEPENETVIPPTEITPPIVTTAAMDINPPAEVAPATPFLVTPPPTESVPTAPTTPTSPLQEKSSAGLNIDTSSPLYEDPDKVILAK